MKAQATGEMLKCKCGKILKTGLEMCGRCVRAETFRSHRKSGKMPAQPKHEFKKTTDHEVVAEYCSMLRVCGVMVPSSTGVIYRPGDAGFEQIAMQYI